MQATHFYKQAVYLWVFLWSATFSLWAGNLDASGKKQITKVYPANSHTTVRADNRFGNITVEHWDRNEVEFRILIESKARKEKTAQSNLNKVSISFSQAGNMVEASTSMENLNQRDEERVTVDYTILVPSFVKLDLEQQFGNISLPESHDGECALKVKFGNIAGGVFTKPLSVESQFSNVTLGDMEKVELELKHCGKVTIGNAGYADIDCQFSTFKAGSLAKVNLDEKHSKVSIKECGDITMSVQHSDIELGRLSRSVDVESLAHSTLEIKDLRPGFSHIKGSASFGTVKIQTPVTNSFDFSLKSTFGSIKIGSGFNMLRQADIERNNKKEMRGKINNGSKSLIDFTGSYTNISIQAL